MLSLYDYILLIISLAAAGYVIGYLALQSELLNYFALAFYSAASIAETATVYFILRIYGFGSLQYRYSYYYSESVMAVLLYFVVLGFLR